MKILIIGNTSIVFPKELADELNKKHIETSLLDSSTLAFLPFGLSIDETYLQKFKKYKKIPKINVLIKLFMIKKIIKNNNFDVVNIHYSRWQYIILLMMFKRSAIKFVITFYGSDFYRTSKKIKDRQLLLYKFADGLSFTNPETEKSFFEYYKNFKPKSYVCRFGLKTLDYIDKNRKKRRCEIKKNLGYDIKKIIVTCGHNSTKAQQHEKMIAAFKDLNTDTLSKIQFIFPLTYGDNTNRKRVKQLLVKSGLDYITLEDFLYEDDNAYIKLASDIMINVLQTDSFSGSMQEFLYADNIIITGSWLPYKLFDESGINYMKIDTIEDELARKLEHAVEHIDSIKKALKPNAGSISKLSSWNKNIDSWIKMFEDVRQ